MNKVINQKQGMVDVTHKKPTQRIAIASGTLILGEKAFQDLINDQSPKGDVLETARVAGVMAAKHTPSIIPMCHPLEIGKVRLDFDCDQKQHSVTIKAEVSYIGQTGVEMEALTAVSAAALTIYDMMKWSDKSMVISNIRLLEKRGGKSGDFKLKANADGI